MKRICKAIAGMLAAVFMGQAVSAAPLLGDVNGDGSVTAKDKMTLARYADGWEGYSIDEDAGDIDRDGDADAEDAQRFGRYFAGYQEEYGIGETVEPTINKIIKDVKLLYSPKAKQNYYVGESFNPDGYRFLLIYDDATTEVKELSSYESSLIVDSNKYDNNLKQFIYPMDGELEIRIIYICNNRGTRITLTIPDIVVATCPILQSIVAESSISFYMLEETPEVQQITVTAKYDNNSTRVFQVPNDATEEEKRNTHYVINKDGVSHVLQITPAIIERDTTFLRISYSERFAGSTISKYDDIEITVIMPEAVLTYYDKGWQKKPYMDLNDALEAAEEYADTLDSAYTMTRQPSVKLYKDVTISYDFAIDNYLEIDLNGFDLTMVPGEIFVKSTSSAEITFMNNGDEDSKIIYSKTNDNENIIITVDDYYVIDAYNDYGKHSIIVTMPSHGQITAPDTVTHGCDVKITVIPDTGYEVKTITIKEGKYSKGYEFTDDTITIKSVKNKLTVTIIFGEKMWDNPFTDVYESAVYFKSVQFVYENGLFSGMSATKFKPDSTMSRAMFITVLGCLAGLYADTATEKYGTISEFTDVSIDDPSISYAVPYINWALANGVINIADGKFAPKDNITHAQMYIWMERYAANIENLDTDATGTTIVANDVLDIPEEAYTAVEYAAMKSFLITSSNRITPAGFAKRSELAMLLHRFCVNVLGWEE